MQPETAPVRTNTMTRTNFTKCAEEPIFESHRYTLRLMRAFAPIPTQPAGPSDPGPDRQQDLFAASHFPESHQA